MIEGVEWPLFASFQKFRFPNQCHPTKEGCVAPTRRRTAAARCQSVTATYGGLPMERVSQGTQAKFNKGPKQSSAGDSKILGVGMWNNFVDRSFFQVLTSLFCHSFQSSFSPHHLPPPSLFHHYQPRSNRSLPRLRVPVSVGESFRDRRPIGHVELRSRTGGRAADGSTGGWSVAV